MKLRLFVFLSCALLLSAGSAQARTLNTEEKAFVKMMVDKHDFAPAYIEVILEKAKIRQSILDAISRPAEKRLTWGGYRNIFLKESRIKGGVKFWNENEALLKAAEKKYGVPPEIIVAIIGVETRYGQHTGKYSVVDALYTLGFHYPKRSKFFRKELAEFLLLAREEKVDARIPLGSYAGAMGRPQFISSSFRHYAVDFDNDGKRDIWTNNADVIGSVANYFAKHGWKANQLVTYSVDGVNASHKAWIKKGYKPSFNNEQVKQAGIKLHKDYPSKTKAALLSLENKKGTEHWLALDNFYVITRYNHSPLYAMAVHQLGQEILKRKGQ